MKSIRPLVVAIMCTGLAAPVFADVTLKQKAGGSGIGVMAGGEKVVYLKGTKNRTDQNGDGKSSSVIIDVGGRRMIMLNHEKKEAEVYDIAKVGESMSKMPISDIKVSVAPTGQTRQIAGSSCVVHDVTVEVPTQLGGGMTLVMSGPHCLVKNGPGQADFAAFYRAAAESGFIFGDPRQAKAQPGQAKAMMEMYRKMSDLGVPFATEMNISFAGDGPMAAMMSKMGKQSMTSEVTSVSTAPLADSLFEIPEGYKVNKR
ncbi:MAG TPA: hypothetical protein VH740_24620 [Vicinamibacterales bacterium]|jgi:hypothetical protein